MNNENLENEVMELEQRLHEKKQMLKRVNGHVSHKNDLMIPLAIVFAGVLIAGAVIFRPGDAKNAGNLNIAGVQQQNVAPQQPSNQQGVPVKVSTAGAPVLGNANAPLTIVEFSDYECPFCKRSFDEVLPDLKKSYIDTGKLKLVFRNFPLPFHANAEKEAEAALCARSQTNDTSYFKFHDAIFAQTTSNGTGLALTQLPIIAKSLGLDVSQFQQCLDTGKFKDVVNKDIAEGRAAGVSGTPSWFIGPSSKDGTINGTLIVGAQPLSAFKMVIDQQLARLSK